jgi:hypothetical protein
MKVSLIAALFLATMGAVIAVSTEARNLIVNVEAATPGPPPPQPRIRNATPPPYEVPKN